MGTCELTILVVDGDGALAEPAGLLREHGEVGTVRTAPGAAHALRELRLGRGPAPDAVVLGVAGGPAGPDGLDVARAVGALPEPPAVVLVADRPDRAVEAFEVGVVDYLLAPVVPRRLDDALWRVRAHAERGRARRATTEITDEIVPVELAGRMTLVPRSQVRFVEAQGDYARLHTREATHLVRISLSVLEERWREAGWVRTHRSYLVDTRQVTACEAGGAGYVVRLGRGRDTVELPVSRRHLKDVRDRLNS